MVIYNSFRDMDDSNSNISIDSDDIDNQRQLCEGSEGNILTPYQNSFGEPRKNNKILNLPGPIPADKPIAHISKIALQNSTDITFGNKTLYNGSVTVNQFFNEKVGDSNSSKNGESNDANIEKPIPILSRLCALKWKILVTTVISACIVLTVVLLFTSQSASEVDYFDIADNDHTELKMIKREEWNAKPSTEDLEDLILPVRFVVIQHTVTPSCETKEMCSSIVRQAQTLHIAINFGDIGYNFLVGGDGAGYVGVGWNKVGAHTIGYNRKSIGIGFIGDFRHVRPHKQQLVAAFKLIREGVKLKKISENYTLIGALQVQQTESPGKMLFEIIAKSPHWTDQFD